MNNCSQDFTDKFPYVIKEYAKENNIPVSVTIELTPFCNFSCVMCYVRLDKEQAEKQGKMLTKEQILTVAQQVKELGTLYLTLTGGEPFSRPDFWEIYSELNKMGFLISILSNGALIDESVINKFEEYGKPYSVKLTLYGASDATYEKVCKVKYGFTKVQKSVILLKQAGIPLSLSGTIVRENAEDLKKMYEISQSWGVPFVHTASVAKSARGAVNSVEASRFRYEEFAEQFTSEQLNINKIPQKESPFAWCSSKGSSMWLTWNGHVQLCSFMNGPYVELSDDLGSDWKVLNKKLDAIKNPKECRDCEYGEFCQRCPGMLCAESGDAEKISESVCNVAKCLHTIYYRK